MDFPLPENVTIHHPVIVYTRNGAWVAEDPMTKLEATADSPGVATHNLHTRLQVLARTSYEKRKSDWETPAVPEKKGAKSGK